MGELGNALDLAEPERLLDAANVGFAEPRAASGCWARELKERRPWETTLTDGLNDPSKPGRPADRG